MRINRSNSEPGSQQTAPQARQAAPKPQQTAPQAAPKAKVTPKPAPQPRRKAYDAELDDDYEEEPRRKRRFPFGCLILLVILAAVGFGAYKVMQFYSEIDGQGNLGPEQTITIEQGSSVAGIAARKGARA